MKLMGEADIDRPPPVPVPGSFPNHSPLDFSDSFLTAVLRARIIPPQMKIRIPTMVIQVAVVMILTSRWEARLRPRGHLGPPKSPPPSCR